MNDWRHIMTRGAYSSPTSAPVQLQVRDQVAVPGVTTAFVSLKDEALTANTYAGLFSKSISKLQG
jgi:hypothetical protein